MSALLPSTTASCPISPVLLCLSISCPILVHNGAATIFVPVEGVGESRETTP